MFSVKDILAAAKGKLLYGSAETVFPSISTDTRKIRRGELFVPIVGQKYDAHDFIFAALKKGASGALTAKDLKDIPKNKTVIKVKNTLAALGDIARSHRSRFNIPVVGITGSSGKTTTKDMLASILAVQKKTLKNDENFNNEIGVPMTLLKMDRTHRAAVIEMAMQRIGEIDYLSKMVRPNVAVVTNIGEAHIGFLRSKKNIAKVKSEILRGLTRKDAAVLNFDDEYFSFLKRIANKPKVVSFGLSSKADVFATDLINKKKGVSFVLNFKGNKIKIDLPCPGRHNVLNALAAAASALSLKVKPGSIRSGLKNFKLASKRMEIREADGIRIINDSYNANPSSVKAALSVLSEQAPVVKDGPVRKIAVLGDMLELGSASRSLHFDVGSFAAKRKIDVVITKGFLSKAIASGARSGGVAKVYSVSTNKEASKILNRMIKLNDVVLIKGSRGMKMEEIAENILK
jgi:UDP-N-acetylmuramoyl-tripeptide--D-alanyl-D-alanine ligase